jgi:lipid A 3-O-deacylase PagL
MQSAATTFALIALASAGLGAQGAPAWRPGDRFLGAWLGASFHSPVGTHLGGTPGRDLFLLGARAAYVLEAHGPAALTLTADLLPAIVVTDNPTYEVRDELTPGGTTFTYKVVTGRGPVYGGGMSLGLELSTAVWSRMRAFAGGAAGTVWFTRDVPVPDSRCFNFTFELGGGLQFIRGPRRAFMLGYKFHHLSNAGSAPKNPGLDGEVFYAGFIARR